MKIFALTFNFLLLTLASASNGNNESDNIPPSSTNNLRGGRRELQRFMNLRSTQNQLRAADPIAANLIDKYYPIFTFPGDGCTPAAMVSPDGRINEGLPTNHIHKWGNCHHDDFMKTSNTYHRYDRVQVGEDIFEVHLYDLYFEKDQTSGVAGIAGGHRHDVETAIIWFENSKPTHMGVSAHGNYKVREWSRVPKKNGHPQVLYHQDEGFATHAFSFWNAGNEAAVWASQSWFNTVARQPYTKRDVTPPIVSWYLMTGEGLPNGLNNAAMRSRFEATKDVPKLNSKVHDNAFRIQLTLTSIPENLRTLPWRYGNPIDY